jgi:hypothetical protein
LTNKLGIQTEGQQNLYLSVKMTEINLITGLFKASCCDVKELSAHAFSIASENRTKNIA